MKRIIPVFCLAVGSSLCAKAQLYIDNATFTIESGATVTVQGDLTSNTSIQGSGKILLKGTALQNVNMSNGVSTTNTIPNLEIDNTANVSLAGNVRVASSLLFTNGKIQANGYNFVLATAATAAGMGDSKFIETNGTGLVQREIGNAAASNVLIPVGAGTSYTPVSLTHSGGTYSNAVLGAQAKAGKSPNAPIRTESYTNVYWPVTSSGVTGGTFTAAGTYTSIAAMTGATPVEADVYGMSYNGSVWSRTGGNQSPATKTVTAQLAANSGQQLFGMNRFLLLSSRVLLQGASPVSGIMNDGLRSGTNIIPTTEPYRSAPYSFTSQDGGVQEVVAASVFSDQAVTNDNIVDWVFVELRNNVTSGATLVQTRSAFVQRDGDIVDVDGVTPLYFKNLDPNNFTVTVRHRNHLAISTNNAGGFYKALAIAPSTSLDFSTAAASNILGTVGSNYANISGYNMMYSGNANGVLGAATQRVSYSGSGNDASYILGTLLTGNANTVLNPVYSQGDVNMNKRVSYSGSGNDAAFILATPLGGDANITKTEVKPQ